MDFKHKLPIAVRDFEKIREESYLYVDKTEFIYSLVHKGSYFFLCRPRNFGKSLFLSTLEAYFKGRRDLFEGLSLENREDEWKEHTVLRLDFSGDVYTEESTLVTVLSAFLRKYESLYALPEEKLTFAGRFTRIIQSAYEKSEKPIVLLIDDYDKPVLDAMFTDTEAANRNLLRSFFSAIEANDFYLKFVFITGISKFASVNVFNGLHSFRDISLYDEYNALCGFTEDEISSVLHAELENGAESGVDAETVEKQLQRYYQGYRFGTAPDLLYNPYSVLSALDANSAENFCTTLSNRLFWIQTGQPTMLIKMMLSAHNTLFSLLYGATVERNELMEYRWTEEDMIPLVYQAGYLSVASEENGLLRLMPPNREVLWGVCRNILPYVTNIGQTSRWAEELSLLKGLLAQKDVQGFVLRFGLMIKDVPLIKQKKEQPEYIYRLAFHAILNLLGSVTKDTFSDIMFSMETEDKAVQSYIFELKMDKNLSLEDVLLDGFARIEEKNYAKRLMALTGQDNSAECKKVVIVFSSNKGGIAGWKCE